MVRRKKQKNNWILPLITVLVTIIYFASTVIRSSNGKESYWSGGVIIAVNNISAGLSFVFVFGLITVKIIEKANRKGFDKWDIIAIGLTLIFTILYFVTTILRAKNGMDSYWSDPWLISTNNFSENMATSIIMGYFLGNLLKKRKK